MRIHRARLTAMKSFLLTLVLLAGYTPFAAAQDDHSAAPMGMKIGRAHV